MEHVAFVAGATGYTGRAVVAELVARGARTVAHVRPDSPRLDEWRARFAEMGAEVDATPWERGAMAARLASLRPTLVFALLGTTRARARRAARAGGDPAAESYEAVDYGLTALLIDAAAPAAPRFVYLSAAGASPEARSRYMAVRGRVEEKLRASGLDHVIARPSFIVGPGRDEPRPLEHLGASLVDGALGVAGALGARRLRDRYRSTTNVDLARALVRVALDPEAHGVFESEDLRG